jgi:hypothetical protein
MCAAVLGIDPGALAPPKATVTPTEVTEQVTGEGTEKEKPPISLEETGGKMEREKGFEQAQC